MSFKISLLVLSLFCLSCSRNLLSPKDYVLYIEHSKKERSDSATLGGLSMRLTCTPLEYYLANGILDESIEAKSIQKSTIEKEKISFFNLSIRGSEKSLFESSTWDATSQMLYYSNKFKNDILAIAVNGDTIPCQNYLFQAESSIGKSNYFEFEFPIKRNELKSINITFKSLNNQSIKIDIKKESNNQPKLKL